MRDTRLTLDWYQRLVTDCQQFIQEAREQIVYKHWQMGKRILEDELKFEKPKYGSHSIANLADNINISKETVYKEIAFAKKNPEFCNALQNLSWRQAIKLLTSSKKQGEAKTETEIDITYNKGFDIITDNATELFDKLKPDSVDLFFTDPPYSQDSLYVFANLAKLAQEKLKEGGLCLTYAPHAHLASILKDMTEYLDYWWIFGINQTGKEARIWKHKLWVGWKPIIALGKKPLDGRLTNTWLRDWFRGTGEDKKYHKWGQPVNEAAYWIEALCPDDGLVVDPYCGSGTTCLATKLAKRHWFGCDINPEAARKARERLDKCLM